MKFSRFLINFHEFGNLGKVCLKRKKDRDFEYGFISLHNVMWKISSRDSRSPRFGSYIELGNCSKARI